MEMLLDPALMTDFLTTALRLSVPIIFAALGGVLAERSGVYNIGLEGMILAGAFGAAVGAFFTDVPLIGVLTGLAAGASMALILAVLSVSLGVNQIVTGIAINLFAIGITAFLSRIVFEGKANTMTLSGYKAIAIPCLMKHAQQRHQWSRDGLIENLADCTVNLLRKIIQR